MYVLYFPSLQIIPLHQIPLTQLIPLQDTCLNNVDQYHLISGSWPINTPTEEESAQLLQSFLMARLTCDRVSDRLRCHFKGRNQLQDFVNTEITRSIKAVPLYLIVRYMLQCFRKYVRTDLMSDTTQNRNKRKKSHLYGT
jgi:hypothetical protein